MLITFAWTSQALLAGEKTVTRRDWTDEHAAKFKVGALVDAWDRSPRVGSGNARKIATIRITKAPYSQMSNELLWADYVAEGFVWLDEHGYRRTIERIVADWKTGWVRPLWVVPFELVEVILA